jgi:hypothetical protein
MTSKRALEGRSPDAPPAVQVAADPDGAVVYRVATPPEGLPAVRSRDLAAAWDAAREAARSADWGSATRFRFDRIDGTSTELALADRDARCWATAVGRVAALRTPYGVSLCLRLLALVDLLARARWAAGLLAFEAGLIRLHPALLRLASASPLSPEGLFDESSFRSALASLPISGLPS